MWRVGRKLGRTIYKDDQCVGMIDTPLLANEIVTAMNTLSLLYDEEDARLAGGSSIPQSDKGTREGVAAGLLAAATCFTFTGPGGMWDAVQAGNLGWVVGPVSGGAALKCGLTREEAIELARSKARGS